MKMWDAKWNIKNMLHTSRPKVKYGVRSLSLFGLHVHSCTHWLRPSNPPPPLPGIWTHIRGRYWSVKIDEISLWPSDPDITTVYLVCRNVTVNIFRLLLATTDPPPIRYSVRLPSSPIGRLEQKFFSPTDRVEQKTTFPYRQVRKKPIPHTTGRS